MSSEPILNATTGVTRTLIMVATRAAAGKAAVEATDAYVWYTLYRITREPMDWTSLWTTEAVSHLLRHWVAL